MPFELFDQFSPSIATAIENGLETLTLFVSDCKRLNVGYCFNSNEVDGIHIHSA